jgi:hypothetical protein
MWYPHAQTAPYVVVTVPQRVIVASFDTLFHTLSVLKDGVTEPRCL